MQGKHAAWSSWSSDEAPRAEPLGQGHRRQSPKRTRRYSTSPPACSATSDFVPDGKTRYCIDESAGGFFTTADPDKLELHLAVRPERFVGGVLAMRPPLAGEGDSEVTAGAPEKAGDAPAAVGAETA